jgi:hypothetical protein
LNIPIESDGRPFLALQGGLRVEALRVFRGKLQWRNRPFAQIAGNYMTKVVVA